MDWTVLLPYATSLGNTGFALWLGQATWRVAGLLTIHLFGLTLLLGAVVVSSLRLIGLFLRERPIAEVRRITGLPVHDSIRAISWRSATSSATMIPSAPSGVIT